jgi:glucokinase
MSAGMQGLAAPNYALAVDIGGTKLAAAVIDDRGQVRGEIAMFPVPFSPDGSASPQALLAIIEQIYAAVDVPMEGIGLSICGNVDEDTGMVPLSPNLHWRYLPFGQMVSEETGLFVAAATDVRMAVLAEAVWGIARGVRYFAWATIGTGYGGYLFLDGRPYRGYHGYAGNFGHATWDEKRGAPCGCGKNGCVETFVSGPGIARAGQTAVDSGASPGLRAFSLEGAVTSKQVFEAAAQGDPAAQAILDEAIRLTAINLGGLVNTLDLEMIVIGGGVSNAASDYVERISARIREFLMTEEAKRDLRVVRESFTNAALYGAAVDVFLRKSRLSLEPGDCA